MKKVLNIRTKTKRILAKLKDDTSGKMSRATGVSLPKDVYWQIVFKKRRRQRGSVLSA